MGGLTWRCIRFGLAGAACVIAVGSAAGVIRLLPWFFAPDVPWQVTVPFARVLLAAACEVSLTVGVPLGFVLAAVVGVRRGEFRALSALGVSPARLARSVALAAVVVSAAAATLAVQVEPGAGVPGRFANALIDEGRAACERSARISWIPLADVTWLCFPKGEARVVAPLPHSGGKAWFAARSLELSDDLRSAVLQDVAVASRSASQSLRVQLRVGRARIRNLNAWAQPSIASPRARAFGLVLAAAALGVGLSWLVFRRRVGSPLTGSFVVAAGGFGLFRVVRGLDRSEAPAWAYIMLPLGVALGVALLHLCWGLVTALARWARFRLDGSVAR